MTPPNLYGLQFMLDTQKEFQVLLHEDNLAPCDRRPDDQMAFLREQSLALTDEIHEALAETGWKTWATSNHINTDAYKAELVDAWHFFMNMMLVVDMDAKELFDLYLKKMLKNRKRQAEGYDGVTTKCPGCRRAYDDDAVSCHPARDNEDAYCIRMDAYVGHLTEGPKAA